MGNLANLFDVKGSFDDFGSFLTAGYWELCLPAIVEPPKKSNEFSFDFLAQNKVFHEVEPERSLVLCKMLRGAFQTNSESNETLYKFV